MEIDFLFKLSILSILKREKKNLKIYCVILIKTLLPSKP